MRAGRPIRILIVDDSAIVRKMLADAFRGESDLQVVGTAADSFIARDLILQHEPDVVTLDVEMPRMDGLTFLRRLMEHHPLPVIIVSSVTKSGSAASIEALRAGAVDVIPKPGGPYSVGQVAERLKQRIRAVRLDTFCFRTPVAAPEPDTRSVATLGKTMNGLLVIGASTGGTQATEALLTRMPADCPPILIVQHMPANFTRAYAERLNTVCPMRVAEASDRDRPIRGLALIAPGDYHMLVEPFGIEMRVTLKQGPPVHHQRPAVDVLFRSAARLRNVPVVACLLTGMGADGADGMVELRNAGAETIAEDEHSCVVFGMPREAIARGGAAHVASLLEMPSVIAQSFARLSAKGRVA
jgi:two-component system, chemotaxis family, protein-glutamate methylesterase/glutaminase